MNRADAIEHIWELTSLVASERSSHAEEIDQQTRWALLALGCTEQEVDS